MNTNVMPTGLQLIPVSALI